MKIWTEISRERLAANYSALSRILRGPDEAAAAIELLPVVKANAYGHGIDPCAGVLVAAGARWLGVTDAHEGARVRAVLQPMSQDRDIGIGHPAVAHPAILVMSGTAGLAGEAECIVQNCLTPVVWSMEHLERLAAAATESPVPVHLEIDTGMSRQGVAPGQALDRVLLSIAQEPRLALDGLLTHFASTEVAASPQTAAQQQQFQAAAGQVAASGLRPRWLHVGNSSYLDNETEQRKSLQWLRSIAGRMGARAMVRSGLALYGHLLPIEGDGCPLVAPSVAPVMTWKTRIIDVQQIEAGARVGYSGTFIADRAMRVALLPVGYADGLRRELSSTNARSGGWVMIHGIRAPVLGRISMNLTTVDVSAVLDAAPGDEVVLLGKGITAQDHARLAGTIAYEILCGVRRSQ